MPSSHLILCHPLLLPPSLPRSGSFPKNQLFSWDGQSIGVSASASVLPMNTQDWSPLGWTGWISLQSKGLSRVFSTTVQKHQFFGTQLSSQSNSHPYVTTGKHMYIHICESESCSVMSGSLPTNGLYSSLNTPGQNTGVGSQCLLWGIFPTKDWAQVFHIAGGFFTSWATREDQEYWSG